MPNIKIYGVLEPDVDMPGSGFKKMQANELVAKIKKLFERESYAKHVVVTIIPSSVEDLDNKKQPYIQLELNCMRGYKQKIEKLKTLGMDIQVVKLYDFIEKT
jgi:hypothetical protein